MPTRSRSRSIAAAGAVAGALALFAPSPVSAVKAADAVAATDSNQFHVERLVADQPGHAETTDADLVNAWGLAASPTGPLWVANADSSTSTIYQGATAPGDPVMKVPLTVSIPGGGAPTGIVFNPTNGFQLNTDGKSGPALFIFAGEEGELSAWNQTGDITSAVLVAETPDAGYKGLTMVQVGERHFLLATNFHDRRIEVFNDRFQRVARPDAFPSRGIPDGYAPFGIATLDGRVYVTYAKQDADGEDDVPGPGFGFVNVFSQGGRFLDQLVRRGALNAPWGLATAPEGFGPFAGKLLVGNFGDGRIHVVDQRTGSVIATLRDPDHEPIEIDGLWGLLPGNGTAGAPSDVWFSAGPDDEAHGLVGILRHP